MDISLIDIIDIALVATVIFLSLRLIQGTRAVQMLIGIGVIVVVYFLAREFGLLTAEWLFGHFFSAFIIVFVVLFQHEIRRGLMHMGKNPLVSSKEAMSNESIDELCASVRGLLERKWGGLIVLERETGLRHLYDTGVEMKAPLRSDMLLALFSHGSPMHDGAVIVRQGVIVAARVVLPLAQASSSIGGTRHRAALGLADESDALVLVISEEKGSIRIAMNSHLSDTIHVQNLNTEISSRLYPESHIPDVRRYSGYNE